MATITVTAAPYSAVADGGVSGGVATGTDNTNAFQNALTAVGPGGTVLVPTGRYLIRGNLDIPTGASLCGIAEGPFDVIFGNPSMTTYAPTLLLTATTSPLTLAPGDPDNAAGGYVGSCTIRTSGDCTISDLMIVYPEQATPIADNPPLSAPKAGVPAFAPTAYPFTIGVNNYAPPYFCPGLFVRRCTIVNAYKAIYLHFGRCQVENCYIGAFKYGIYIDGSSDGHSLSQIRMGPIFDDAAGLNGQFSNADRYVFNNLVGYTMGRADGFGISACGCEFGRVGFNLTGSMAPNTPPVYPFGQLEDVYAENVKYCVQIDTPTGPNGVHIRRANFVSGDPDNGTWLNLTSHAQGVYVTARHANLTGADKAKYPMRDPAVNGIIDLNDNEGNAGYSGALGLNSGPVAPVWQTPTGTIVHLAGPYTPSSSPALVNNDTFTDLTIYLQSGGSPYTVYPGSSASGTPIANNINDSTAIRLRVLQSLTITSSGTLPLVTAVAD